MKVAYRRWQSMVSYGMPTYSIKKPMAWINSSKTGISLGFREGGTFEDKYGLLRGTGKHAKNVRMKSLADVNTPAFKYYIKQALKLDNR